MTMHQYAVEFAHAAEQDTRLKELAQKQDAEGLTDREMDEFVSRIERIRFNPFIPQEFDVDED